jgi:hypothetical protein
MLGDTGMRHSGGRSKTTAEVQNRFEKPRITGAQDSVPGDGKGGESGGDNCDLGCASRLCCAVT